MCSFNVEQNAQNVPNFTGENSQDIQTNAISENTTAADDTLDDATIEEGDEHRMQISGALLASMMCVENPESFREIICVAPAEGERLLN